MLVMPKLLSLTHSQGHVEFYRVFIQSTATIIKIRMIVKITAIYIKKIMRM